MTITLRTVKGSTLTHEELDGNFTDLDDRVDTAETKLAGVEDNATADQSAAEIETAYNAQVAAVGQAEAEAGTATTVRRWTAERVAQAIAALAAAAQTASEVPFTPAGSLAATDVQAALEELDSEKATAAQGAAADTALQPGDAITELDGTAYRLPYIDSGGNVQELAHGTATYPLVSGGASTNPAWGQLAAGGIASDAVTTAKILARNVTPAKLALTAGTAFTTDRTLANSDNDLKRLRWQGTSVGRLTIPSGLATDTDVEIVSDATTATSQLTVDRAAADNAVLRTALPGARLLRRAGRCRIHVEDGNPRVTGDLEQGTMATQNSGASFLLERGLRQTVASGIISAWGDKYGENDFTSVTGSPPIEDTTGAMSLAQSLDDDAYLQATLTYSGTDLLVGFCGVIDAATGINILYLQLHDFGAGYGLYSGINESATTQSMRIMTNASTGMSSDLTWSFTFGRPFAVSVAIHRAGSSAGYAYGFMDEGYDRRERQEVVTGQTFVTDWTAGTVAARIGSALSSSQAITAKYYAVTIRDDLTFANANDARDQAAAMLYEMREYRP